MSPRPRFGVAVPTATEGMMYPVPYADIDDAVHLGVLSEQLGYDSVWGNDHVSTQAYVRREFADPPNFYDPLTYLAYVAAMTERIRLATCVLVLPFRHPVLVAKQAATLDRLSHGRFVLGIGVGAYREEFEAMWPDRDLHRGRYVDESIEAVALLLSERRASYRGKTVAFDDVESFPHPVQQPLPILSGGNSAGARRRAGRHAAGWLPACLTPAEYAAGLADIEGHAADAGRTLQGFEPALQLVVSVDRRHETAVARFRGSQVHAHLLSLSASTMAGRLDDGLEARNLVGTPDEVGERIEAYRQAGVEVFAGLLFAADSVDATVDAMTHFSEEVLTAWS